MTALEPPFALTEVWLPPTDVEWVPPQPEPTDLDALGDGDA